MRERSESTGLDSATAKAKAQDLVVCGGRPAFPTPLHVGRPNVGDRNLLRAEIDRILDRRWLTNAGPTVRAFERELADRLGVRHCIAVCNATVALEVAIRALGLSGEVIVPAFTFIATAHAARWLGVDPVFCDVDQKTHNLDPIAVEAAVTSRTTGIIGVHLWGNPCAVDELAEIASRHKLALLFDAAHACLCSRGQTMIGNFGALEVFSFHATKFINTFEGGAITTNRDDLAATIRLMINFGFAGYDRVVSLGTNGKMHEISAAMGLNSLDAADSFVGVNRENYESYQAELSAVPGLAMLQYSTRNRHNYQYVVVEVDPEVAGLSRDELVAVLRLEGVLARRYFHPGCHRMEPYASEARWQRTSLPRTEGLASRVMVLPTGTAVDGTCVKTVSSIIRTALEDPEWVRRGLAARELISVGKQ
jgi:dTDP-4-amino-4,6-dideoxygalactose transaminase